MKKWIMYLFLAVTASVALTETAPARAERDFTPDTKKAPEGLSGDAFQKALQGWNKLREEGRLANPSILTIIDFSQSSRNKRMYVIDMESGKVLYQTLVAHGRNTGEEYATQFSNEPSSLKSSLGFYITSAPVISPKHGQALLIEGVEKGFNCNARKREIIVHAADYVSETFVREHGRLGRSFGCPALPPELNAEIIEKIKGGSCMFMYQPNAEYLNGSKLLN